MRMMIRGNGNPDFVYGYRHGDGFMNHAIGAFFMLAVLVVIVVGMILLFRYLNKNSRLKIFSSSNSALNILNERYAKGEISDEEYNIKKKNLTNT